MMGTFRKVSVFSITLLCLCGSLYAASTYQWLDVTGDWSNPDNWNYGEVPGVGSTVYIDKGRCYVTLPGASVHYNLYVGRSPGFEGELIIESGDLTSGYTQYIGSSGTGTVHLNGGTHYGLMGTIIGRNIGSLGTYELNGGTLDVGSVVVGEDGTGIFIQRGGLLDAGLIMIGSNGPSSTTESNGTFEIWGGDMEVSGIEVAMDGEAGLFDIKSRYADINVAGSLSLGATAEFKAAHGSRIELGGGFDNRQDSSGDVSGLSRLNMVFEGGTTGVEFEIAGENRGAVRSGYCGNFVLDTLTIGGDDVANVDLVDNYDNGNRNGPEGVSECLYVRELIIRDGCTLDLNGLSLYYQEITLESGGTILDGLPTRVLMWDIDGDGTVGIGDLNTLMLSWLDECTCPDMCGNADLNGDGVVDEIDVNILAEHWGESIGGGGAFWQETFDSDPGWTTQGQWQFGTPLGGGGVSYGNPDPTSGATGDYVYGVNLAGDYDTTAASTYYYLTSEAIDCTLKENVELRYMRWLNTYWPYVVPTVVSVSTNGTTFTPIWYTLDERGSNESFEDSEWTQHVLDVSDYADNCSTFYIRWGYWVRTGALPYSGWNIDDVELSEASE